MGIIRMVGTLFLTLCILIGSCNNAKTDGGSGAVTVRNKVTEITSSGSVRTTETETSFVVKQPDNPDKTGGITYSTNPDGTFDVAISTGGSYNVAKTIANSNLLRLPMYAGIGLIPIALAVGYFTRNIKWAIIIGVAGVIMIAGSYLLAEYALYFLALLGILLLFGAYLLYDYYKQAKANNENVKLMQKLRQSGAVDLNKFKEIAEDVQSKSTVKIVDRIKEKTK